MAATKSSPSRSVPLPPHLYEGAEYFCRFRPRIHRDVRLADAGSWQCQVDFLESSAAARASSARNKGNTSYAVGCINPIVGNFTALCACEAIPERLALTTYLVEYAYIHDDGMKSSSPIDSRRFSNKIVIEYAEDKDESRLRETNRELIEGLSLGEEGNRGSKDHVRRRQLQAKMAVELMEVDAVQAKECLRLWKEMSDVFVQIRDRVYTELDDYLRMRAIDAGCPWTMSLLCFSMDFALTQEEEEKTSHITSMAYDAWVLVNDYFSWDKEWHNHQARGGTGLIANAVFLFMKWHSVDAENAKIMLRKEILSREDKFIKAKNGFLASGDRTPRLAKWFQLLEHVTAGNFAWSMTTARYQTGNKDSYPDLRAAHAKSAKMNMVDGLSRSISTNAFEIAKEVDIILKERKYLDLNVQDVGFKAITAPSIYNQSCYVHKQSKVLHSQTLATGSLNSYEELVLQPHQYLESLPSKGIRNSVIDGLEMWYQVPEKSLEAIREIISLLHNSTLMLDDIEDNSPLRRGLPATHMVFGVSQTINTANLLMFKALKLASSLSTSAVQMFTDRVIDGHIGQGLDLYWTYHTEVPTEEDYFTMVDGKTGSLFVFIAELMRSEATAHQDLDASLIMKLIGRFFQARDDYQNLQSAEYTQQKGFAEDISEGKISLPLIYALRSKSAHYSRLMSIMQQRKARIGLPDEIRRLALREIKATGALEHVKKITLDLQEAVEESLLQYEKRVGVKNWILRLAQKRLEIE